MPFSRNPSGSMRAITQFAAAQPGLRKFVQQEYLQADGVARIAVNLEHIELADPFSMAETLVLSPDLFAYIDRMAYPVPVEYPLRICLHAGTLPPERRAALKESIARHYLLALQDKRLDVRINKWRMVALFGLGALLLAFSFFLNHWEVNAVLREFLSIAATFSLWEGVDCFLLEQGSLRTEVLNAGQLAMAEIVFAR